MAYDGLTDIYSMIPMGVCADKTAKDFKLTRQEVDNYCINSYEKVLKSIKAGLLKVEIAPVTV